MFALAQASKCKEKPLTGLRRYDYTVYHKRQLELTWNIKKKFHSGDTKRDIAFTVAL